MRDETDPNPGPIGLFNLTGRKVRLFSCPWFYSDQAGGFDNRCLPVINATELITPREL